MATSLTEDLPHLPANDAAALRQRQGTARMVGGGLLLGTLGVFVQEAGQDPLTTGWYRWAYGAAALLLWTAATGRWAELRLRGAGPRAVLAALAAGVLMILNWPCSLRPSRAFPSAWPPWCSTCSRCG